MFSILFFLLQISLHYSDYIYWWFSYRNGWVCQTYQENSYIKFIIRLSIFRKPSKFDLTVNSSYIHVSDMNAEAHVILLE